MRASPRRFPGKIVIPDFAGMMNIVLILALALIVSACTFSRPPPADLPNRAGIQAGPTIVVKGSENIYAIAHEHNVSMREIIVLNDLKPPFEIKPGQRLVLPATGQTFAGEMPTPEAAPLPAVERNNLSPIMPPTVSSQSLEPTPVQSQPQPLPPPAAAPPPPAAAAPPPASDVQSSAAPDSLQSWSHAQPAQKQTTAAAVAAAPAATVPVAEAAASDGPVAMKWPLQGPILSGFGPKGSGLNNDGINIGAPKGSPVVASAAGTVVYAGNDMKGFGNLVLIKHQGEWVTAYAHLDRVLVKKDSVLTQGDMIGTVGKTGSVSSPQLHFEIRQSGKPVDPAQVIKTSI